ncbi:MAG: alpha/beta hydrolase [Bacteriovoracaceae bacterium]|nr:alpha/beta hydrolase [Bacteriovoracaceae bacterium]
MRRKWLAVILAAATCVLLIGAYLGTDPENRDIDEDVRAVWGGSYTALSRGVTHYSLDGPADGRLVVLVHGGTIPMFTWDDVAPRLASDGYRILCYDMYGRGYSDRPRAVYDRQLFQEQLDELLDAMDVREPVDLVGYSHGGGVAADFAAKFPSRVRSLVLISPVVYGLRTPTVLKVPVLGEILMRVRGVGTVTRRALGQFEGTPNAQRHAELVAEQAAYRGFRASLLSMLRHNALSGDYRDSLTVIGKQEFPVMIIWGPLDREITEEAIAAARSLIPRAQYHAVAGAGHDIVFKKPEHVAGAIEDFLRSSDGPQAP